MFRKYLEITVWLLLIQFIAIGFGQFQNPCPNVFQYVQTRPTGNIEGRIEIRNVPKLVALHIILELSVATSLPTTYVGKLELAVSKELSAQALEQGGPLIYRVHFPVRHPLPLVLRILFNGKEYCTGRRAMGSFVTTIVLEHTFYPFGATSSQTQDISSSVTTAAPYPESEPVLSIGQPIQEWSQVTFPTESSLSTPLPLYRPSRPSNRPPLPPKRPPFPSMTPAVSFVPYQDMPARDDWVTTYSESDPILSIGQPIQEWSQETFQNKSSLPTPLPPYRPSLPPERPSSPPDRPSLPSNRPSLPPYRPSLPPESPSFPSDRPSLLPNRPSLSSARPDVSLVPDQDMTVPDNCGRPSKTEINFLVVNGEKTEPGDWPWIVAIFVSRINLEYRCAGSLISNKHVLTAGHCLTSKNSKKLPVSTLLAVLGRYKLRNWAERDSVTYEVSEYKLFAEFNRDGASYEGDLAVMSLMETITFGNLIAPICLWSGPQEIESLVGKTGFVVGWGRDELGNPVTPEPRMTTVPIVSQEECLRSNADFVHITSNRTFCGGARDGNGPCNGDSGGGLAIWDSKTRRYYLRGIVSLSLLDRDIGACDLSQYIVYTDVAKYVDWIQEQIATLKT